jgi:intraflagellar transport protein 172
VVVLARCGSFLQVIISHGGSYDPALLDSIAASLARAGLQERCGDLYQHLNSPQDALQAYRKGHAYRWALHRVTELA